MNFFGKEIAVQNVKGRFFVDLHGVLPDEAIEHSYSAGLPLDNVLPLLNLLKNTGWEGVCQRELLKHIVLDRVFRVGDMPIPTVVDVDFGRRMRLSTYKEDGQIWVCAVQLEQAALGIHYDLRVAEHLKPAQTQYIHVPFRPRLVWQNDREMMVYFIPLDHVDQYFKLLRTELTSHYVDPYVDQIQSRIEATWATLTWM